MTDPVFIGIDAGTTSIKGILADAAGNILAVSSKEYALEMEGDRCEIDAEVYWHKTKNVIHELLAASKTKVDRIQSLSFASQGETLICVDEQGHPVRKAIVWLDNRSASEAKQLEEHFGAKTICDITGQPQVQPLWPATRILWLRQNEPDVFKRTHKFLLVEDFLIFKLTGNFVSDQTLVSSTLYYDIRGKKWWREMLHHLTISEERLPEVFPSGKVAGTVTAQASTETGLPDNVKVITGAYDHVAGALGAGNYKEGTVTETTGTSMAMVVTLEKALNNFQVNLPMQCHAIEGKFLLLPYGQTAGLVLKWFREQFCEKEMEIALADASVDVYDLLTEKAAKVPAGSDGLIMLPHLMGSGSPEFDANAKGVFAGVTHQATKGHFIRAILEAVAAMIRVNLEMLANAGITVTQMRTLGGGSKSHLWNQIKADMTGVNIQTVGGQETAALGAVILAAAGAGFFNSVPDACDKMVKVNHRYHPNRDIAAIYESVYHRYVNLTKALERYW